MSAIAEICARAPVIPVLVIENVADARPLAEALVAGGLPVLEVTLRTEAALPAIAEMARVSGAVVGAGTLLRGADPAAARDAGATFGVAPGATDALLSACDAADLPLLPGAATASEMMRLMERGFETVKFFPAEAAGGVAALRALAAPLGGLRFCPTGGISLEKAPAYLELDCVPCFGASWVAPARMVGAGDWAGIEALARQAAGLAAR